MIYNKQFKSLFFLLAIAIVPFIKCSSKTNLSSIDNVSLLNVSYTNKVQLIIKKYCYSCHSGEYPKRGIDLTTYSEVRFQTETGNLLKRINDSLKPMPIDGLMALRDRELILNWMKNGCLEN